jgi:hypothetical protein
LNPPRRHAVAGSLVAYRCRASPAILLATAVLLGACSGGEATSQPTPAAPDSGAVLYGVGLSTDPYGSSSPDGFGVATGLLHGNLRKSEVRGRNWCTFYASWLERGRIIVPRYAVPTCGRPVVFRYRNGRLERDGALSLPSELWGFSLSPDGQLVAAEPSEPCCEGGSRPSGRVLVARPDGSARREVARGRLGGWTPAGDVLVSIANRGEYVAVDPESGERAPVLSHRQVAAHARVRTAEIAPPRWSADRRYIAAQVYASWPKRANTFGAIVLARADGTIIRLIRSPYTISMLAWSPRGHRLAYTTSGFPDPHELFVLDEPSGEPRRLFATGARHFDWITWSPDGRSLLLDDEHADRWRLIPASGDAERRALPRLGGRPIWCCPQNEFSAR